MKMWHIVIAVFVGVFAIVGGIFIGIMVGGKSSVKQETANIQEEKSAPEAEVQYVDVTMQEMADDITKNAAKAKKKYMGKHLKIVGGEVHSIDADASSIMMGTSFNSPIHFFCKIAGSKVSALKEQIADLNTGQKVTVYGHCTDVSTTGEYSIDMNRLEVKNDTKNDAKFDKAKQRIGNAVNRMSDVETSQNGNSKQQNGKNKPEKIFVGDSVEKLTSVWGNPTEVRPVGSGGKSFTYVYDGNRIVIVVMDKVGKIVGFTDTRAYPKVVSNEDVGFLSPP